uniref:Si:dkey-109a10.2 n=1 Tax=Scleropages formosus TaxID=113540 RepID=A0A8C9U491_SCLFO
MNSPGSLCFLGRTVCLTMTLGWAFSTDLHKVQARCNDTITLPCSLTENTSDYRYAVWYKLNFTRLEGIVRKSRNGPIQPYDYRREARLGDSEALVLPWVQPEDSGEYQCMLGADIGKQNQFLNILLNVSECVATSAPTFAPVIMATNSNCVFDGSYMELSPARILSGFSVLGLVKAMLCLLSIWVFLKFKKTHSM